MLVKAGLLAAFVLAAWPAAGESDWCKSLYARKCASCHGADGSGAGYIGKKLHLADLRPRIQNLTDEQIAQVVLQGKGKMPANKRFSADQVEGLTVYLRVLASGAAPTMAVCAAPSESIGHLYGRHCASCHGRDGTGSGTVGRSLKIPDLTSSAVQSASDEELAAVVTTGRGRMRGYGSILIPEQINELIAYVRDLPTGAPEKAAPVAKTSSATKASSAKKTSSAPVAALAPPPPSHPEPEPETAAPTVAAPTPPPVSAPSAKSQRSRQSAAPEASNARTSAKPTKEAARHTSAPSLTYTPPKRPPDVHEIYARKCSSCHSRDGSGSGIVGRQMRIRSFSSPEVKSASDEQLAAVIASGRGKMPAFGKKLSSEEITLVVGYIRKLIETGK